MGQYGIAMHLTEAFLKLPVRFDVAALKAEVAELPASAWVPHATGFPGNEAVRLVTVGGQPTDAFDGPMKPTEYLADCPYVQEIMAELGGVWGRSRFMGLGVGAEVPEHIDVHYHWRTHLRIHIPVFTNPQVEFTCGGETIHMAGAECWLFDSFRWHEVHNRGDEKRTHLVLDTVITDALWTMIDDARSAPEREARLLKPGERAPEPLYYEQNNAPLVMNPWEVRGHLDFIFGHVAEGPEQALVRRRMDRFADGWAGLWARFGDSGAGLSDYHQMIAATHSDLKQLGTAKLDLDRELSLLTVLEQLIFVPAVAAAGGGQRSAS